MPHSPAPFDAVPFADEGAPFIKDANGVIIANVFVLWDDNNNAIAKANQALFLAAPELLEACEKAKKYLEPDLVEPGRTVFWDLVSAIKKAKGEM